MIHYQLVCDRDHGFEAWFSGSQAFEDQKARGLLVCPACGSTEVDRALMAPAVATREGTSGDKGKDRAKPAEAPAQVAAGPQKVFQPNPQAKEFREALRALREHVVANADYVGDKFAEEARKIHYEEAEQRGIYGETSAEEAAELMEEGIEFHPLPVLPEDKN